MRSWQRSIEEKADQLPVARVVDVQCRTHRDRFDSMERPATAAERLAFLRKVAASYAPGGGEEESGDAPRLGGVLSDDGTREETIGEAIGTPSALLPLDLIGVRARGQKMHARAHAHVLPLDLIGVRARGQEPLHAESASQSFLKPSQSVGKPSQSISQSVGMPSITP